MTTIPPRPLRAEVTSRDDEVVISLEGTAVASAPTEPQAVSVLCAEAIRLGRSLLVEVRTGDGRHHLQISATGYVTRTAGAVPNRVAAKTEPVAKRGVAIPKSALTPSYANPVPTAPAVGAVRQGAVSSPGRRLRARAAAVVTAAAAAGALVWSGGIAVDRLERAGQLRDQVAAIEGAPVASAADVAAARAALPAQVTAATVTGRVRQVARTHRVTVSQVHATGVGEGTLDTSVGEVAHQTVGVTLTAAGPRRKLYAMLTDLTSGSPLLTLEALEVAGAKAGTVTARIAVTGHAAPPAS